jgi:hypothetical protein
VFTIARKSDGEQTVAILPPALAGAFFGGASYEEHVRRKNALATAIQGLLTPGSQQRNLMESKGLPLPYAVIVITEAWMVEQKKATNGQIERPKVMPAEHPDKKEVLMVQIFTSDSSNGGSCPIIENPRRAEFAELYHETLETRFGVQQQQAAH